MCVCVCGVPACRRVVTVPSWPPLTRLRNGCNDPGEHGIIKVVLVNATEGVTTAQPFLEAPITQAQMGLGSSPEAWLPAAPTWGVSGS